MILKEILQKIAEDKKIQYYDYIDLIEKTKGELFNFKYPTPNDSVVGNWRDYFETQFCIEFMEKEPITEDFELFKLKLNGWLNLNMPYYVNLLESELWFTKYVKNPVDNKDYHETFTRTITQSNVTTTDTTTNGSTKYQTNSDNIANIKTESTDESKEKATTETSSNTNATTTTTAQAGSSTQNTQFPITGIDGNDGTGTPVLSNSGNFTHPSDSSKSKEKSETELGSGTSIYQEGENIGQSKTTNNGITDTKTNGKEEGTNESKLTTDGTQTNKGDNIEVYDYHGYGNIGTQTAGEVIEHSRKAFINVTKAILKGEELPGQKYYKYNGDKLTALFNTIYTTDQYGEAPFYFWYF